ncbi:type II toxin-antitoxin system death-on-curing family toxin [Candidatus Saccharibacteria bacterium]|nr:type II toxin-antitoxin system death-on-curing family toxin [Candidatus Saccharibacteria bacterium]
MNHIPYDVLLQIHDRVLAVSGGMAGVKDEGLLRSPLEFIVDDSYYPELCDKITHVVYSLIKNHGFNDGNKRTALAVGGFLLLLNGYDDYIVHYFRMFEQVVVLVADNKLSKEELYVLFDEMITGGDLSESSKIKIIDLVDKL